MEKIQITVVGAGVIGLAVALELSRDYKDVFVIEKNPSFGQETSSRNSEVIHAGIYYPKGSLKAATCTEGRPLLYEFLAKNNISHKRIGKLIVAIDEGEAEELGNLFKGGLENGLDDLRIISKNEIKKLEPNIEAKAAIYSPSTGILDTHGFMKNMSQRIGNQCANIAYSTELIGVDKVREGFEVMVKDKTEGAFKFITRIFVNTAGLSSDKVAKMAGLNKDEYRLKYCKGDYFRVSQNRAKFINRLIYPVPKKEGAGLGVHATLDLSGGLRLGPDDEYIKELNYNVDPRKAKVFYESTRQFLPFIGLEDLSPDMAGVRPKLQGPGEDFRDFIIKNERESGLAGFINLLGIESPGLTSSLAIARIVKEMVKDE